MTTTAIKTYLDPDLARDVARLARAQGRSESAVIADAVRFRLAASSESVSRAASETQKRQLNRIEARLDKSLSDQAVMKECILLFVRVWLEHNPPIDDELAESAAASAEARFERFLDLLMKGLSQGRGIADAALNGADPEAPHHHDAEIGA